MKRFDLFTSDVAEANMLYLETPIGVGFSYSTYTSSSVTISDDITGICSTNYECFLLFLCQHKFKPIDFLPLN